MFVLEVQNLRRCTFRHSGERRMDGWTDDGQAEGRQERRGIVFKFHTMLPFSVCAKWSRTICQRPIEVDLPSTNANKTFGNACFKRSVTLFAKWKSPVWEGLSLRSDFLQMQLTLVPTRREVFLHSLHLANSGIAHVVPMTATMHAYWDQADQVCTT